MGGVIPGLATRQIWVPGSDAKGQGLPSGKVGRWLWPEADPMWVWLTSGLWWSRRGPAGYVSGFGSYAGDTYLLDWEVETVQGGITAAGCSQAARPYMCQS